MALLKDILISTAFVSQEDRLQFLRQKIACANPEELLYYEHLIKAVVYYAKPEDREWFLQHALLEDIHTRRMYFAPKMTPPPSLEQ